MKVLVLSDTHIPVATDKLSEKIIEEAKSSDCCIHAGDFLNQAALETLNSLTKTYGVCGNMDDEDLQEALPKKQIIKLEEITIGLIHGRGNPNNLINYINKEFSKEFDEIDIFVFGHSHYPLNKEIEGKIYFNPGSSTDKVFAPYLSYGILEINGKEVKRRIEKIG